MLVVDAVQVDDVLFGDGGAASAFKHGAVGMLSSTVAPHYTRALAARILAKDVGIAAEFAASLGQDATFANEARAAIQRMVNAGHGELDDAAICKYPGEKDSKP